MDAPVYSLIICSIDAGKFARVTALYRGCFAGTRCEVIGIHDARSLTEGYNRGARAARGDILIFSHDDVDIVSPDVPGALNRALNQVDIVGIAGTSRIESAFWPAAGHPWIHGWISAVNATGPGYIVHIYGVDTAVTGGLQALDGVFFALRREVLTTVSFDEVGFDGFHGYDVDFTFAAYSAGLKIGVTAEIALIHFSSGMYPPEWFKYRDRFAAKYRDRLPPPGPNKPWSFARVPVLQRADIAPQFPLERLQAITRQLRATAALK